MIAFFCLISQRVRRGGDSVCRVTSESTKSIYEDKAGLPSRCLRTGQHCFFDNTAGSVYRRME